MFATLKRRLLTSLPSSLAGRLRAWRIRRMVKQFKPKLVEHTYGRNRLKVWLTDPLSRGWYDQDWPELPEITELAKNRLRAGARVFDLGAHQGVVAAMLAQVVGPTGRIVAVEANRHNAETAIKNRDSNQLAQIDVLHAAVSDRAGKIVFNEGLNGQIDDGTGSQGRQVVDAVTIDELAERFGPPNVVFLDVEGAEQLALAGASKTLRSGADFFIEVHVNCGLEQLGGNATDVLACFPAEEFELLIRAEGDDRFCPLGFEDPRLQDRFFLLAFRRRR